MTRRMLTKRLRSRLQGERGFTIVESVVAMVVIFGSLTGLAYTATIGFRYIGYGRDRQQATSYANKIMEEIRGQAYSTITRGMSTTDLAGDSLIVSCSGVDRFESCSGPKIVSSTVPAGTTAPWIIPHKSSSTVTIGNLKASWATYVTNNDPTTSPYTVTVIVSWISGAIAQGPNNIVRLQSNFWSPSGCVSATTHPFAAPCQPYFYGLAQVPEGSITFTGALHDRSVDFENGVLTWPAAQALSQQEQVISTKADAVESRFVFEDFSGLEEGGDTTAEYTADSDPASTVGVTAGGALAGAGDSGERMQSDCCDEMGLRFNIPAGQIGNANASTAATSGDPYACPPFVPRETDSLACAGAQVKQTNTVTATVPFDHVVAIGDATIARLAEPSAYSTAAAERDAVSGQIGLIDVQATRNLGDFSLGGFPTSGMTAPTGMTATNTLPTNYCMNVTGYNDTARVYAGATTVTGPDASVGGGTFSYWNSLTNSYTSLAVTSAALDTLEFSCSKSQMVGTKNVTWEVEVLPGDISRAQVPAYSHTTDAINTQIKKETQATVRPITITFHYRLIVNSVHEIDLVVVVDPGTLSARGVYGPPPAAG